MAKIPAQSQRDLKIRALEKRIARNEQALEALKREKLFSEKVLDSLPGIFYLYNEDGEIIRWNKNHETLTGFSAEQLPHRNMFDWFTEEDGQRIAEVVEAIYTKGARKDVEAGLIIKNGQSVPYHFTGVRMIVDGQKYLLGVGIDISDKMRVEENLRKSEAKYRTIFENAVEGIFQTTPKGRMVSANPAMARILGYDSPRTLIRSVKDIAREVYVSREARLEFLDLMKRGQAVSGYEVEFFRKDGVPIWVSLHARPVIDKIGRLRLIEGLIVDITTQKRETDAMREREAYLRRENLRLRSNIKDRYRFGDIVGKSAAMQAVYETILKAADTDANIILYGESGTGKELVARAIYEFSDRKAGRFVPVNCGAIPQNLLESEFFGYKRGAFTGAAADKAGYLDQADGGVLFLDELGEIDLNLQVKLLRVLEGSGYTPVGGVDLMKPELRIVAATNRDLQDRVANGLMREDFFYRIHIIPIHLPPLRERKEDIPLLVEHFMKADRTNPQLTSITGEMMEALLRHDWPGNVRELQNVLHRYRTLNRFEILLGMPPMPGGRADAVVLAEQDDFLPETWQAAMAQAEKTLLVKALEATQWHRGEAARRLGLARRTFFRKLKQHGLIRHK